MNIGIIGSGSLGLLFAAKCARAKAAEVYVITRTKEQQHHLQQQGVQLKSDGITETVHLHTASFEQTIHAGTTWPQLDWLLVFVKQQHIDEAFIRYISYWTAQGVPLLCFQNGIGHVQQLRQSVPETLIYTAITSEAALRLSDSCVEHTGRGETTIGHDNEKYTAALEKNANIIKVLQHAGFTVFLSKKMRAVVWKKLLVNAVINPLTAIFKVPNGALVTSEHWLRLMRSLYDEGVAVATSAGIELSSDNWDELLAVCQSTAHNRSSMLQDVLANRMTEIEWINGAIIRMAQQKQLLVPTHQAVYDMVKGMESQMDSNM